MIRMRSTMLYVPALLWLSLIAGLAVLAGTVWTLGQLSYCVDGSTEQLSSRLARESEIRIDPTSLRFDLLGRTDQVATRWVIGSGLVWFALQLTACLAASRSLPTGCTSKDHSRCCGHAEDGE